MVNPAGLRSVGVHGLRNHRRASSTMISAPAPSLPPPPLTLTPPHTQILDKPSAVAAAERQEHEKECIEGIEEAKGVAARWKERGEGGSRTVDDT